MALKLIKYTANMLLVHVYFIWVAKNDKDSFNCKLNAYKQLSSFFRLMTILWHQWWSLKLWKTPSIDRECRILLFYQVSGLNRIPSKNYEGRAECAQLWGAGRGSKKPSSNIVKRTKLVANLKYVVNNNFESSIYLLFINYLEKVCGSKGNLIFPNLSQVLLNLRIFCHHE